MDVDNVLVFRDAWNAAIAPKWGTDIAVPARRVPQFDLFGYPQRP